MVMCPVEPRWVEQMREELDAFGDSWPRAREVGIRVDREYGRAIDTRNLPGELDRLLETIAAGSDDDHFRLRLANLIPRHSLRITAGPAHRIDAARDLYHLRNPVSGAEQGLGPLEKDDATAGNA